MYSLMPSPHIASALSIQQQKGIPSLTVFVGKQSTQASLQKACACRSISK